MPSATWLPARRASKSAATSCFWRSTAARTSDAVGVKDLFPLGISCRRARKNLADNGETIECARKTAIGCSLDDGFDYLLTRQTDIAGRACELSELALKSQRREGGKRA